MLIPVTSSRLLYWLAPVPYADGSYEAGNLVGRPLQQEYG